MRKKFGAEAEMGGGRQSRAGTMQCVVGRTVGLLLSGSGVVWATCTVLPLTCMYLYVLSFVVAQANGVMSSLARADTKVCVMDHPYPLHTLPFDILDYITHTP